MGENSSIKNRNAAAKAATKRVLHTVRSAKGGVTKYSFSSVLFLFLKVHEVKDI